MGWLCCFGSSAEEKDERPKSPAAKTRDRVEDLTKVALKQKEAVAKPSGASTDEATWEKKELLAVPDDFLAVARGKSKVSLAENSLDSFTVDCSSLASSILILDVSDNRITALPPSICVLHRLECLYAYKNQLASLPTDIGKLQSLRELNVFNNKITELPQGISTLKSLELLNVASNLLGKAGLPPLHGLTSLKRLALFWNKLTVLPSLDGLHALSEVQLQKNLFTTLPSLHTLTSLKSLSVNDNKLTALPPSIGRCVSLEELAASKNAIEALPAELATCPKLVKLVVSQNRITSLSDAVVLTWYETLDVSDNQLTELPRKIGSLPSLTNLFVQGNKLTALPEELAKLTALKRVNLLGNPLPAGLPLEDTLRRFCETNQGKFIGSQKVEKK